ncbi:MAG: DUF4269 domain-containing protein [Bacteroidota bacterium]
MLPAFESISYLKVGTPLQRKTYDVLCQSGILSALAPYNPVLAGTLPLDLFIPGQSDLDILCEVSSSLQEFSEFLIQEFSSRDAFSIRQKHIKGKVSVIACFNLGQFAVEIFGQATPVCQQAAFRHMITEYKLLQKHGEAFKEQILKLKKQGIKTEPAFALVLGLHGDAYDVLLNLEV